MRRYPRHASHELSVEGESPWTCHSWCAGQERPIPSFLRRRAQGTLAGETQSLVPLGLRAGWVESPARLCSVADLRGSIFQSSTHCKVSWLCPQTEISPLPTFVFRLQKSSQVGGSLYQCRIAVEIMEGIAASLCPELRVQQVALPLVIKAAMMHRLGFH